MGVSFLVTRTRIARYATACGTHAGNKTVHRTVFNTSCLPCSILGFVCDKKRKTPIIDGRFLFGDPDENRTRVTAVKGRCLSRLTTGPELVAVIGLEPTTNRVWTECSSQLSYTAIMYAALSDSPIIIPLNMFCQVFFEKLLVTFEFCDSFFSGHKSA